MREQQGLSEVREGPGLWSVTGAWSHVEHHLCFLILSGIARFAEVPGKRHAGCFPCTATRPSAVCSFISASGLCLFCCLSQERDFTRTGILTSLGQFIFHRQSNISRKQVDFSKKREVNFGHQSRRFQRSYCLFCLQPDKIFQRNS